MEQPSEITPRLFAVNFERTSGRLAFTVVLLALCPKHALAQVFLMFPGFRRAYPGRHVQEAAFVDIDWEISMAFVAKQKSRPPMPLMDLFGGERQAAEAATSRSGKVKGQG